ncbi:schlafen family member 13-like [Ambystoma mexicanum]|uniref:schlafen family member 13-like n=1 Tax=Ambystoma mexicanum TaxID=8296 RepID=UPI0037E9615E
MTAREPLDHLQRAVLQPMAESGERSQPSTGARIRMPTDCPLEVNLKTCYPDVVLEVGKVIFGEKERNHMRADLRKDQNKKITRAACALLNSGGGVIKAEICNPDKYIYKQHGLGLDIAQSQRDLVQSKDLPKYFEYLQQNKILLIFVKSWSGELASPDTPIKPHICTLSTNLYCRSDTSTPEMNSIDALEFLKMKKSSARHKEVDEPLAKNARQIYFMESNMQNDADDFFKKTRFQYGEKLSFGESMFVDFKHFKTNNFLKRFKETLPKYISAFANTQGGYLIFGVEDDTGNVFGFSSENACSDTLKNEIERAVEKLSFLHFCNSDEGVKWEMKTMTVHDQASCKGLVCALKIEPFCCAVFLEHPDSWIVHENHIKQLDPKEWKNKMMATDPDIPSLTEHFNTALSISDAPPSVLPVYIKKGLEGLDELRVHLCGGNTGGLIVEPKKLYKELSKEYPELRTVLKKQMEDVPASQGLLMFSKSWAVDVGRPQNEHVVCDALLIVLGSYPILYTFFDDQKATFENVKEYSRCVAYTLKQKLVNIGGYTGRICVIPKLCNLCQERSYLNAEDIVGNACLKLEYPYCYKITNNQTLTDLQKALVIVLLNFRSFSSDQLGCEFFNLLTIKQYEILSTNLQTSPKLFIHGLPGTGKTVVAMKIIEKIKNVYNCGAAAILYICENKPLRNYIHSKNICLAVTRINFITGTFPRVQHIVIDEAQNFRREDGDWFAKAEELCSLSQNHNGPGVLWIFLDFFQKYHPYNNGLPPANKQFPKQFLTKVVRNATQIYHIMETLMKAIVQDAGAESHFLHKLLESAKCGHTIPGFYEDKHLDMHEMDKYVAWKCSHYLQHGYSPKDIAILCNTEKDIADHKRNLQLEMRKLRSQVSFVSACDNIMQRDDIVLDSVRRFSGLERTIIFGIHPVPTQLEVESNFLLCVASRANMKLHILFLK